MMKRIVTSLLSWVDVPQRGRSGHGLIYDGPLSIFDQDGWPTATWSRVSPVVLCEIDEYVHALARR